MFVVRRFDLLEAHPRNEEIQDESCPLHCLKIVDWFLATRQQQTLERIRDSSSLQVTLGRLWQLTRMDGLGGHRWLYMRGAQHGLYDKGISIPGMMPT